MSHNPSASGRLLLASGVNRALQRLWESKNPPTAILVANPVYYLSVVSHFQRRRMRIPEDISLVSRDDDSFLGYLTPEPTRYRCSPKAYAKRLLAPINEILHSGQTESCVRRIEPKYVAGGSLRSLARPSPL